MPNTTTIPDLGIILHHSVFSGMINLSTLDRVYFGHIMKRTGGDDWTAWLWTADGDECQGTFATRHAAYTAMSVLAP